MDDIKEQLRIKTAAAHGLKISADDPINTLIDVVFLWIKENNKALLADLLNKATTTDAAMRREHIKQFAHMTKLIEKIPLELSSTQKKSIRDQVHLAMAENVELMKPLPWWKTPTAIIGGVNMAINLGILAALILIKF